MVSLQNLSNAELLSRIKSLEQELQKVKQEKADLEIMIESIAEHSSELNNLYFNKNQELLLYIEQVKQLAAAITRLDRNSVQSELEQIAARKDELGKMAEFLQIDKGFKTN